MKSKFAVGGIVLFAAAIRAYQITDSGLWLDEYTSIEVASRSLQDILAGVGFDRHTPPFYYILLNGFFLLYPPSEISLRMFSLLFDIANVLLIYLIASRQFSTRIGLWAAAFYSVAGFSVYYAQEGRMYTLLVSLVLLAYSFALRFRDNSARGFDIAGTAVVCAAGLYTHYYFAFSLIGLSLGLLLSPSVRGKSIVGWLAALAISGICFFPWVRIVLSLAESGGQQFRRFTFSVLPYTLFRFVAGYAVMPLNAGSKDNFLGTASEHFLPLGFYLLSGAVLILCGLYLLRTRFPKQQTLFLSTLFIAPCIALAISLFVPMLSERYLIVVFPFFIILCVLAKDFFANRTQPAVGVLVLLLFGSGSFFQIYSADFGKEEWREVADLIGHHATPTQIVFVNPEYTRGILAYYLPEPFIVEKIGTDPAMTAARHRNCWLVERGGSESALPTFEHAGYHIVFHKQFFHESGIQIYLLNYLNG